MRASLPEYSPPLLRKCAQCSADIIAAEWSEHLSERRVRNLWSCEACGYQFEDEVYFAAQEKAER
jgi:ribosomal protein L37AE/L43A